LLTGATVALSGDALPVSSIKEGVTYAVKILEEEKAAAAKK